MRLVGQNVEETYQKMLGALGKIAPAFELRHKAELVQEIEQLKRERGAIILGHNYMEPALYHTVADYVGDSLGLARIAAETTAPVIVFCGVEFMAETAKILNPSKTVLLPAEHAGCSLASSITAADVRALKARFPGVPVITYVNCYADVKAESDACCTSSNAAAVVESFKSDTVIMLPDEYLARNVARETGKRIIFPEAITSTATLGARGDDQVMVGWHGKCEVHEQFTVDDISNIRRQFPDVVVLAHPECHPDVVAASDFAGSTTAMVRYVQETKSPRYLLLTECAMGDNIIAENPHKDVLRLCSIRCPHMNQITLEDTRDALLYNRYEINVPEDIRIRAKAALDRMLAVN